MPPSCPASCEERNGDSHCDSKCYLEVCDWDLGDCDLSEPDLEKPSHCADGCPPENIDNNDCTAACNVEACRFDGADCDHDHDECYTDPNGADYRGSVNVIENNGGKCRVWDQKRRVKYLKPKESGLGGHNHCRNPLMTNNSKTKKPVASTGPWCWTEHNPNYTKGDPKWGYCTLGTTAMQCGYPSSSPILDQSISGKLKQGLVEVSDEAAAAPLIAAILSCAAVLLLGLTLFTCGLMKVWHRTSHDSRRAPRHS